MCYISSPFIVPKDIFWEHRIESIEFDDATSQCKKSYPKLKIHPEAFRASHNFTKLFRFSYCDMESIDFSFLNMFTQTLSLVIQFTINWSALPPTFLSQIRSTDQLYYFSEITVDISSSNLTRREKKYSPCYFFNNIIHCGGLSGEEIKDVFNFTTAAIVQRVLILHMCYKSSPFIVPDDIFTDHRIESIEFDNYLCVADDKQPHPKLHIHPEAFRSSREFATNFSFSHCDMGSVNFSFLNGFTQTVTLTIKESINLDLRTLPSFISLNGSIGKDCVGNVSYCRISSMSNKLETRGWTLKNLKIPAT